MNLTNYHILKYSPWPIMISIASFFFAIGFISWVNYYNISGSLLLLSLLLIITIFALWSRDTLRESMNLGMHSLQVKKSFSLGFIIFMISETFFFSVFIWSYFYNGLNPTIHIGNIWPPLGINPLIPWTLPLLNSLLLLTSGATLTWSHNSLLAENRKQSITGLIFTIVLGLIFSLIQIYEYLTSSFTISDSIFGTIFYTTLSLHGLHVWIGSIWLYISLIKLIKYKLSNINHQILEGIIIFWHLVDFIWIILFIFFYVWLV